MDIKVIPGGSLKGSVRVPGDKSISHRAVMFGSLAEGRTEITGILKGRDCMATVRAFQAMGVDIRFEGTRCIIDGSGWELKEPPDIIDVENSGTTFRLLLGILAGSGIYAVLSGDSSIRRRPMGRVVDPLRSMGANIWGRDNGMLAPISLAPSLLRGIRFESEISSAQVKSAIILAGLRADGETSVREPILSRDHTERMLGAFGVTVERSKDMLESRVRGGQTLRGCTIDVPGDISSAAFPLAAAAICSDSCVSVTGVGINPTRDGFLDAARYMGVSQTLVAKGKPGSDDGTQEPVAFIETSTSELCAAGIGGVMIPRLIDEIPILGVLAAFAEGTTEIRGAKELRVKESDRISALYSVLKQGGVKVKELPDGLVITGLGPGGTFTGGVYPSFGDHRIAMALCVAGLRADSELVVQNADAINTSFPGFIDLMNGLFTDGCKHLEAVEGI